MAEGYEPIKNRTYSPLDAVIVENIVYTIGGGSSPQALHEFHIKSGELFASGELSYPVTNFGPAAFMFREKVLLTFVAAQGTATFTLVDPSSAGTLASFSAPSEQSYNIYELADSFLVPNMQGLVLFDKKTLKPVYRTLDMSNMIGVVPKSKTSNEYLVMYDTTIEYRSS